jgi:hypothetical protein
MIFNSQTLLSAFDKKGAYHSPKCFSTIVTDGKCRFEPKDYPFLPKGKRLQVHLYSIWEDKFTCSMDFVIKGEEMELLHD